VGTTNNMRSTFTLLLFVVLSYAKNEWLHASGSLNNDRFADDAFITASTVQNLQPLWNFTCGDVSVTPSVVQLNGITHAFFPDWNGTLYALNAFTGQVIWQNQIINYTQHIDIILGMHNFFCHMS
jgi:glucose dehydrogenase